MASLETQIRRLQRRARKALRRYRLYHERRIKDGANIESCWIKIRANADEFNDAMKELENIDITCPKNQRLDRNATDIWGKPERLN